MARTADTEIIESLQQLGLSLYEARLYVGLLTGGPQNGNELSRTSGVPSSKVYATLENLANAGIVARSRRGNNVEYVAVSAEQLLHKLREKYTRPLEYLDATLPTIVSSDPDPDILQIASFDAIVDHVRVIIRNANGALYLSVWSVDLDLLREDLATVDRRGIRIFGMVYGGDPPDIGWWQRHSYQQTVSSRISGRMLTVVADGGAALVAHVPDRGAPSAIVTRNPVLCLVTEEYLIHDLTLQRAKTMTGYEEWDRWMRSDEQVRLLTLGRTGHWSPIEPEVPSSV